MEQGFVVDQTYGATAVAKWASGEPRKSFWTGLNLSGADPIETTTYRCRACGYLESYA